MYTASQKHFLLNLARRSITRYLELKEILKIDENELELALKEKRGVFVTLTLEGHLRGCIGHIEPIQPLYLDVIENALNAAFNDFRFYPLEKSELSKIRIEISILSKPQVLQYNSRDDLLKKLTPFKDGVILRKGSFSATYLPQVWEGIPRKEEFLSSLCQKAGLDALEWEKGLLEVKTYFVESFEE